MASHKSAKKRIRSTERKKEVNKRIESRIKTLYNKALNTSDAAEGEKIYKEAVSYIDKNSVKNKLHKNNASRKKAALTRHLNKLQKETSK
jgi:small subunit ribosomal protein S20